MKVQFRQGFAPLSIERIHDYAAECKRDGWRYVQTLAVNTDNGVDLVYSFMKDGVLDNKVVRDVPRDAVIPSITDLYLEAFVFENEIHDLFGVNVRDIAIDFGGNFYQLAANEPMTIISPEQLAKREKARKIAEAKAAKEAKAALANAANAEYLSGHPEAKAAKKSGRVLAGSDESMSEKLAGMDPEKVARVKAAMAAKAKKAAAEEAARAEREQAEKAAALEEKLAGMDPEKAAKVRAAMEAKAARAQKAAEKERG